MKKIKLITIILCIVCLVSFTGCAGALLSSMNGDSDFTSGINAYEGGRYEEALEYLKEAERKGLKEYEYGDLYAVFGHCYVEIQNMDKAFEYYNKALDEDPDSVEYLTNIAVAYRKNGDFNKAKELYSKALEIDPDYPELNVSLGAIYVWENDPETAIYYLDRAIELDPSLSVAYANASVAYAMAGDFETAREYLGQAIVLGYDKADLLEERIDELENYEQPNSKR